MAHVVNLALVINQTPTNIIVVANLMSGMAGYGQQPDTPLISTSGLEIKCFSIYYIVLTEK
jgi:hypothetical protein